MAEATLSGCIQVRIVLKKKYHVLSYAMCYEFLFKFPKLAQTKKTFFMASMQWGTILDVQYATGLHRPSAGSGAMLATQRRP